MPQAGVCLSVRLSHGPRTRADRDLFARVLLQTALVGAVCHDARESCEFAETPTASRSTHMLHKVNERVAATCFHLSDVVTFVM